jgi:MoxR-like ATPase
MTLPPPPGTGGMVALRSRLATEVDKVVVGQRPVLDAVLVALSVGGHVLLEGPPGVAKTLLVSAIARCLGISFHRIQFTPDMLPSDVTGTIALRGHELVFRAGPVFTNLLLADEINRTPPKTQAALLEAMQEGQVSVDGVAHPLPQPFAVLATLNPIEFEGTYPLPEAQLDRFLMKLVVGYPSQQEEEVVLRLRHSGVMPDTLDDVEVVADASAIAAARADVDAVSVSDPIVGYVVNLVRRTRELPSVSLGPSPRAAVHLLAASKAVACLAGRSYVLPDDVIAMTDPVLRHRLVLTPEAELDRFRPEQALQTALSSVPIPR